MVFEDEGEFKQFVSCKFRENVIRILYVPTADDGNVFLVVNKFGTVGLYHPVNFSLLFTYVLDLNENGFHRASCQKTHFVTDAVYAVDLQSVVFSTTKNLLIFYDVGEIERQSIGLELLPNQESIELGLRAGRAIVPLKNKGHVETHRLHGLMDIPYCIFYSQGETLTVVDKSIEISQKIPSLLIVGDQSGSVTIFSFEDPKKIFGLRKIRGVRHELNFSKLENVRCYKAHRDIVLELIFIPQRQLLISCSRDRKSGLFIQDLSQATDPSIIQFPKGVNTFAHSEALKLIATGSDDYIVRILSQYSKGLQMELTGHKSPIIGLKFSKVSFSENPLLISYSKDVELKAWDPVTFICLQSVYITFPIRSTLICKTPEFGKQPLFIFQPHYDADGKKKEKILKHFERKGNKDGFILVTYCNSYARLYIERDTSNWPFDFHDFVSEFEEVTAEFERKVRHKKMTESRDPKRVQLSPSDLDEIDSKLDTFIDEMISRRRRSEIGLNNSVEMEQCTIASKALKRFHCLKLDEVKRGPFSSMPLLQLEPIEFSQPSKLRMTKGMKKAFGQEKLSSTKDLIGETATKYFAENLVKARDDDANITIKALTFKKPMDKP